MNLNGVPTNPGELRTKVTLQKQTVSTETGGFQEPVYTDLATVRVKWVNVHGSEVWASQMAEALAPATVFMRYRSDVDLTCVLSKGGKIYEITSIDDVRERHEYLELKVVYVRSG
jgi:SPP1 family predicted phage head-tail adaptor